MANRLLSLGLLTAALLIQTPIQAQTVIYQGGSGSVRTHRYDQPARSDWYHPGYRRPGQVIRGNVEDSTLVNPVIIDSEIEDSTLVNPVIVTPSSRTTVIQQQPTGGLRNPSCIDFGSMRAACQ